MKHFGLASAMVFAAALLAQPAAAADYYGPRHKGPRLRATLSSLRASRPCPPRLDLQLVR